MLKRLVRAIRSKLAILFRKRSDPKWGTAQWGKDKWGP